MRIRSLDLFRFVAALSVVMYHYAIISAAPNKHSVFTYEIIDVVARYGYLGVDLFFIISGFVIAFSSNNKSLTDFFAGRFSRLFPAYWVGVSLTTIVIILLGDQIGAHVGLSQFLINLTMLQQFLGVPHIDGVYWTLTYELVFYFWVGLLLLFHKRHLLVSLLAFFSLLSLANLFVDFPGIVANVLILDWVFYFFGGVVFYDIYANGRAKRKLVWLLLSCSLAMAYAYKKAISLSLYHSTDINPIVSSTVVTLFYVLFFYVCTTQKNVNPKLGGTFSLLGRLTYPLYLIHGTIGVILFNVIGPYLDKYVALLIVLTVVLLTSWLINRYIEDTCNGKVRAFIASSLGAFTSKRYGAKRQTNLR